MTDQQPFIETEMIHGVLFIRPIARINGIDENSIQQCVAEYFRNTTKPCIVIDFYYVTHMTIDVQQTLCGWLNGARKRGGDVKICGVASSLQSSFHPKFPHIEIYPSEKEAASTFFNDDRKLIRLPA